jgi:hypothetical protein
MSHPITWLAVIKLPITSLPFNSLKRKYLGEVMVK